VAPPIPERTCRPADLMLFVGFCVCGGQAF
jgi:hypothetical protein